MKDWTIERTQGLVSYYVLSTTPVISHYYPPPNQMNKLLHDNIDNTRHHKDCIIQIQPLATVTVMRYADNSIANTMTSLRMIHVMHDTFRGWLNSKRWLTWTTTQILPSKLNQLKPIMSFQAAKPTQMGSQLKYPTVEEARAQQSTLRW